MIIQNPSKTIFYVFRFVQGTSNGQLGTILDPVPPWPPCSYLEALLDLVRHPWYNLGPILGSWFSLWGLVLPPSIRPSSKYFARFNPETRDNIVPTGGNRNRILIFSSWNNCGFPKQISTTCMWQNPRIGAYVKQLLNYVNLCLFWTNMRILPNTGAPE